MVSELQRSPLLGQRIAVIGRGRMGRALSAALRSAGADVEGPLGRRSQHDREHHVLRNIHADIVLIAVTDAAIAEVASELAPGALVGHLSGSTSLGVLAPNEAFGLHPLLTVTGEDAVFAGAAAAVAGSTPRALQAAEDLAALLGLAPFVIADEHRAAYHAAATAASNFVVTVAGLAEELADRVGVDRQAFRPLAHAAVENWARLGAADALTGPIARGDEAVVDQQRAAIVDLLPERLALFDALVDATRALAATTPDARER